MICDKCVPLDSTGACLVDVAGELVRSIWD